MIDFLFRQLLIELALGNVASERFNQLLLQTGVLLDDYEWEAANKILEKSEEMQVWCSGAELAVQ